MIVEAAFAQNLAGLLAPALPYLIGPVAAAGQKAAEAAGGKIGEDAWRRAKEVWHRIKPWADKKPEISSTLKEVAEGDPLAKDALSRDLKKLLECMPDETVDEIRKIVIQIKNEERIVSADRGGLAAGGDLSIGNLTTIQNLFIEKKFNDLNTAESPEKAKYYLDLGLDYIDKDLYTMAIDSLFKAQKQAPQEANVLYYISLALIRGRRIRTLTLSEVKIIEEYLNAACRIEKKAHYLYLSALIKQDFYLGNGLRPTSPSIDELLEDADQATLVPTEISRMLQHIQVPENQIIDLIKSKI
jgi:hypothetical protein